MIPFYQVSALVCLVEGCESNDVGVEKIGGPRPPPGTAVACGKIVGCPGC